MYRLRLSDVSKAFLDKTILTNINLAVQKGEFIVLLGPSGCGKTTLLRMIAGLETMTTGTIEIDQHVVNQQPPRLRDVAMVFQNYSLYLHKTVASNLAFGLKMRKTPPLEIKRRVDEIASLLRLQHHLKSYPARLSGGEKQRVAIGRALVRQPKLYLFDEPLSNLDAALRLELRTEIKRLHQKFKTTSIYVTHDQVEAMSMADRLVVMNEGKIVQIGTTESIYKSPENTFVAGFIGNPGMNFFQGQLEGDNRTFRFDSHEMTINLPYIVPDPPQNVILGIRPEHLSVKPGKGQHSFQAKVVVREDLGLEQQLVLENADGLSRLRMERESGINPDDIVQVFFDSKNLHWFNVDSGEVWKPVSMDSESAVHQEIFN